MVIYKFTWINYLDLLLGGIWVGVQAVENIVWSEIIILVKPTRTKYRTFLEVTLKVEMSHYNNHQNKSFYALAGVCYIYLSIYLSIYLPNYLSW